MRLLHTSIPPKFMALRRASFEIATHVCAVLVDRADVWMRLSTVKHAAPRGAHLEGLVPEVPGLQAFEDVAATGITPTLDVGFGHENGACALKTAGTARQAIEFLLGSGHQRTYFDRSRIYAI